MTHTHIKTAIMLAALAAGVAPCAAQGSFDSWAAGGYAGQSTNGAADAFFGYMPGPSQPPVMAGRQPPSAYAVQPNAYPPVPGSTGSTGAYAPPQALHYAPESRARTAPDNPAATLRPPAAAPHAYGYPSAAAPGYGYPGVDTYGSGLPGYGYAPTYGIPPYGGNLPGLGYPGLGGLHTPGLYGNPYLGSPALLHNPYAYGVPGLYGPGPYGL